MRRRLKQVGLGVLVVIGLAVVGGGIFIYAQVSAYEASLAKVYDVAPLALARSTDPEVIARGKHLTESLAGCALADCHGKNFGGGKVMEVGPIGTMASPNITAILPAYSDGELARLLRHGIKKDGRSVRFMSVPEFNWLPDSDVVALISYLRTVPPAESANAGGMTIGVFGKVLDRLDQLPIDVARRIDHAKIETGPPPAPTAEYGKFIAHLCVGCHGERLSGGKIPGTPPGFPVPLNLTPHATGLAGWTFEDFEKVMATGTRKDGRKLDEFMPVEAIRNMDDQEKRALFAYLQSVPPVAFGNR